MADPTDCDDTDAAIHPAADEVCDGVDNDCDGDIDIDAIDGTTWYPDVDGDTYGDANAGVTDCTQPTGYIADGTDCDDTDPAIHPGATEYCDGVDNDCDGDTDESNAVDVQPWYRDDDGDGYGDAGYFFVQCYAPTGYVADSTDCDDTDPDINPGEDELCDAIDNDCSGVADDNNPIDGDTYYADTDDDGYGDPNVSILSCDELSGYVTDNTDCDDTTSLAAPSVAEFCDGIDNDCDGDIDEADSDLPADGDGDGVAHCDDCDDSDGSIYPGAAGVIDVPGDYAAIQDAIDAAVAGDVVCVEPGTYVENLDFDGKGITVTGPATAIVDGNDAASVVLFDSSEGADSVLQGLTLTNGYAGYGGGIYIASADPTIIDIVVEGNRCSTMGGGVYIASGGADPTFTGGLIANNEDNSWGGGGIWIGGGGVGSFTGTHIYNNRATGQGGGVHLRDNANPTFTDVIIEHNYSDGGGGGLHMNVSSTLTMNGGAFTRNWTDDVWGYGGGLHVSSATAYLDGVTFNENRAEGCSGGGASIRSSTGTTVTNCTFAGNSSVSLGAAIWTAGTTATLTNLLVQDNERGVAVYFGDYDDCVLSDSLITNNDGGYRGGVMWGNYATSTIDNSLITDNTGLTGAGVTFYAYSEGTLTNSIIAGNIGGGYGAGIYMYRADPTLENVIVAANEARSDSWGCGAGIGIYDSSDPVLNNVTVVGNILEAYDGYGGAGICVRGSSAPEMTNVLVTGNILDGPISYGGIYDEDSTAVIYYSNSWGNDDTQYEPDIEGFGGNISSDPELLDLTPVDPLDWDLHLDTTSACVGAGDFAINDPDASRSDIGAYGGPGAEYWDLDMDGFYEWWQPGIYDDVNYPALGWDCDDQDEMVFPFNGCGAPQPS